MLQLLVVLGILAFRFILNIFPFGYSIVIKVFLFNVYSLLLKFVLFNLTSKVVQYRISSLLFRPFSYLEGIFPFVLNQRLKIINLPQIDTFIKCIIYITHLRDEGCQVGSIS